MSVETRTPEPLVAPEQSLVRPGSTVAFVTQKGGNGKTVSAVTVGAYLASLGVRVNLLDADPQDGSATGWLLPDGEQMSRQGKPDLSHALMQEEVGLDDVLWPTGVENLRIAPSFPTLNMFEMSQTPGRDYAMMEAIEESETPADVNLIDCRPSLGQLTISALVAADDVVIPFKVGGLDFRGVAELNKTLRKVRKRMRPEQRTVAVITTQYLQKTTLGSQIEAQFRADYPQACHARVRHTVRVGEAPLAYEPLTTYAPKCTAMLDYIEFTDAVFAPVIAKALERAA